MKHAKKKPVKHCPHTVGGPCISCDYPAPSLKLEHTPTPYKVNGESIISLTGVIIAMNEDDAPEIWKKNAAFIVRACNSHDEFTKLLNRAQEALDVLAQDIADEFPKRADNSTLLAMLIRKALNQAKKDS